MLYFCEKYGPLETLEKYDPKKDPSLSDKHVPHPTCLLQSAYTAREDFVRSHEQ